MLIWCLDPRDCTSTTPWIDFLIAIWLLILVMIKTNGKMSKNMEQVNKKWDNMSKDPGLVGPLGGLCSISFPKKYDKNTCINVLLPQSGILNKSTIHVVLMTMCTNVKRTNFTYHWNIYIYIFYIFAHIFLNHVPHITQDICYKLNKFCNLVVICDNQYDEFHSLTKNSTH